MLVGSHDGGVDAHGPVETADGVVIDNITGSATFSNTKVSGAPSGGLSNSTTTFTIVRGPGNSGF